MERMKHVLPIPVLILTVYAVVNLIVPVVFSGGMILLTDAALWTTVIVLTVLVSKHQQASIWQTNRTLIQLAAVVATFQLFLGIFSGFFLGFGKNANIWTSTTLAIYLPYLLMPLLAAEISRAYLAQTASKRKPIVAILMISLLYTLIGTSVLMYASIATPLAISEFLIRTLIPTLAVNLLATYLAFLGGFSTNLTYSLAIASFTWFSPILPNPPWAAQSLMTVIGATIGFAMTDATSKHFLIAKPRRTLTRPKPQLFSWTAIALICLIAVWSSTGLLGFTPTIVGSGSMTPTLQAGDLAFIIRAPVGTIRVGDIIQYQTVDMTVIHRVIGEYSSGGSLWFTTKGDANSAPDPPVNEQQVLGKMVLVIPRVGLISMTLKELATDAYWSLTHLPWLLTQAWAWVIANSLYVTAGLAILAYSYLFSIPKDRKKGGKPWYG
jgi:signal peptidase